jgi:transcription factor C subunit 7
MGVQTIILLRHGHRLAWTLDPSTGKYTSSHPFPTKLPADPPLASHGVTQAQETGKHLTETLLQTAKEDRLRIYSSLFYRCLETLRPTVDGLNKALEDSDHTKLAVRGERGVSEWFGKAWFDQPVPATPEVLQQWFPWVDQSYRSLVIPERKGERILELHSRIKRALDALITDVDREFEAVGRAQEPVTVLICGHAAQIIATGRALTGDMPEDLDEEDFHCYTCGLSSFERKGNSHGMVGTFDCVINSDCSHLSGGAERGWHFSGDESFDSYEECQSKPVEVHGGARDASSAKI